MNFWPRLLYGTAIRALSPLLLVHTIRQSIIRKGGWQFLSQRMGWTRCRVEARDASIWVHAASVGEVRTVIPLIEFITSTYPAARVTLTCNTPEARNTAATACPNLAVCYCPVDFPGATRRLFRNIQPAALVLVETEIWPYMLYVAGSRKTPVMIVNGRLSHKTTAAPAPVKFLYRQALQNVTNVLARSGEDEKRFIELGLDAARISNAGNLKRAYRVNSTGKLIAELQSRPYVLAASTHDPEEQILLDLMRTLPDSPLLVIVPRHPQRSAEIQQHIRDSGHSMAVRSKSQQPTKDTRVYLADTTGEMDAFLQQALIVFMGGTLSPVGGHNLLEPAACGKAIVCGPSLSNFEEESALLQNYEALWIVEDERALQQAFARLLASPEQREKMGASAKDAFQSVQHSLENYKIRVSEFITTAINQAYINR